MTDPSIAPARLYLCHVAMTDSTGCAMFSVGTPTELHVTASSADHARQLAEHKLLELGLQGQVTQVVRLEDATC